jgi:ABC-type nickel/cobalt efflux system permease component RcnA
MKLKIKIVSIVLVGMMTLVSCNGNSATKEESTTVDSAMDYNTAEMATYQCPMKCEGNKTYDKAGACPVCKMDMAKVGSGNTDPDANHENHDHHDHEGHDHSHNDSAK